MVSMIKTITWRRVRNRPVALLTPDLTGRYGTRCPHGHIEAWHSLAVALIATRYPEDWCAECRDDLIAGDQPTIVMLAGRRDRA